MQNTRIGWVGLGRMGTPMSQRLIKAGCPVTVYNRNKEKEQELINAGAASAASPMQLMQRADVIILMVSDDAATRNIFTADDGLLAAAVTGKIIINMSTVSPDVSREMSALCDAQQNCYIDAPVSGSVKQAEESQLVIMAGGEETAFLQAKLVLEKMGKLVMYMGEVGSGNTTKLAMNTLLALQAQGLAEAAVFAQKHGIALADLFTLINNSAMGSIFLKIKGDAIAAKNYQPAFALKHIVKDLQLARNAGLQTPLAETALKTFSGAESAAGESDIIAIAKELGLN
ncbi:NAD(P)-dependent oxidoreductase [Sediminibacterium ginsengisoli]|uniref:3-hydroxyisobutyrate dehydrogenase n=1 Tax=Sediminibacterium ginsengisoli TaxID=413434 RepID=A0A1T4P6B2_9BACT|nr:NAD(P)-dependent oxidoreductase [Sediminibacterium ginsengisoli]SJZ86982.1 3-hydroxyisobutyrate dehydrogenase [Sediminibacterium ginsengisoli]